LVSKQLCVQKRQNAQKAVSPSLCSVSSTSYKTCPTNAKVLQSCINPLFHKLVRMLPLAPNPPQLRTTLREVVASQVWPTPISVGHPLNQPTNANSPTPSFLFRHFRSHRYSSVDLSSTCPSSSTPPFPLLFSSRGSTIEPYCFPQSLILRYLSLHPIKARVYSSGW
jgi:hypothetical protein